MLVVIAPPGRDPNPCLSQAGKPVIIQTLVTKAAIEAFNVCILRRLACLNQFELDTFLIRPLV
jgi:hypothetical protein